MASEAEEWRERKLERSSYLGSAIGRASGGLDLAERLKNAEGRGVAKTFVS